MTRESTRMAAEDVRSARIQLMHFLEPQDHMGMALIHVLGPVKAYEIVAGRAPSSAELDVVREERPELSERMDEEPLQKTLYRWRQRQPLRSPLSMERTLTDRGSWLAVPEDEDWPEALAHIGERAPIGLWGRGDRAGLSTPVDTRLAVVGCRDSTNYGHEVTGHLVSAVAAEGYGILSGAAFGIDAVAHRTALATGTGAPSTIAFLACGIDRTYPRAHEELLRDIERSGLILTELNPGSSPMRHRFLQRNRLIAALSAVTLVVEARLRSGALNTARHALEMGRTVGVVPGPVFSAQSAGCHRLVSEAPVELVTSSDDLLNLLPSGEHRGKGSRHTTKAPPRDNVETELALTQMQVLVREALPARHPVPPERLCSSAGLPIRDVLATLAQLEQRDLAECRDGLWKMSAGGRA